MLRTGANGGSAMREYGDEPRGLPLRTLVVAAAVALTGTAAAARQGAQSRPDAVRIEVAAPLPVSPADGVAGADRTAAALTAPMGPAAPLLLSPPSPAAGGRRAPASPEASSPPDAGTAGPVGAVAGLPTASTASGSAAGPTRPARSPGGTPPRRQAQGPSPAPSPGGLGQQPAPPGSAPPQASTAPPAPSGDPAPRSAAAPPALSVYAPTGLTRSGGMLLLDGQPYRFTGVNAFSAATWYGTNLGCGAPVYDIDGMFSRLRPDSVVRFWAFQALGWNNKGGNRIDFTGIDRVVAAAERNHQRLILTLTDQAGTCDDGRWHDQGWYDGGYTRDSRRDLGNLSFLDWTKALVARYANSPAVAFWEPVNEPQAANCKGATGYGCYDASKLTCPPGAAQSIRRFYDAIGAQIRALDPRHLISAGMSGGGQCGMAGGDFQVTGGSSYVDLLTFHDYEGETDAYPRILDDRLRQAAAMNKPLAVEEAGIMAGQSCRGIDARAQLYANKISAAFRGGAAGYLPWWYTESGTSCGYDFGAGDPLLTVLRNAPR